MSPSSKESTAQWTGPPGDLSGLRALVTGAGTGIGRAIATRYAAGGARVILHANRSFDEAVRLGETLGEGEARALALRADLNDPQECRRLVAEAFGAFGGLDVWVNNAGADILSGDGPHAPFEERLDDLLRIDVRATILLTREAGKRLREAGGGAIINLGWDQALTGMAGDGGELFATAKGAVMAFTKSAALSLAPSVRVNCIAPGWIRTAWAERAGPAWQERAARETPLGRWGTPQEVAEAAAFLASRAARFITGQIVCVNGGAVR